jgi:hypothetical protein
MNLNKGPAAGLSVEILLSTYNGAEFLNAFMSSLVEQDEGGWSLTARDDGSSDDTVEVLRTWGRRLEGRIRIIDVGTANLGHVQSFSRLLEASSAPYVMFADQDDVWLPAKVGVTLGAMRSRERVAGAGRPIVVSTDAVLVDRDLRVIGPTAWESQGRVGAGSSGFARVIVENVVLGCTAMLNRPLIELIHTIPPEALYHDWWIALVASAFGDVVSLAEPSILWRRHGSNESDHSDLRLILAKVLANPLAGRRRLQQLFSEGRPRVAAFLRRYGDRLRPDQKAAAEAYVRLLERGFLARRMDVVRHGLYFAAPLRNAGLLALL